MDNQAFRDEIKIRLTGGLLDLELSDESLDKIIQISLREIQRYICSTKIVTVPFSRCIDLSKYKVSSVSRIYRAEGFVDTTSTESGMVDPMYAAQWQILSGTGDLYNFQNYMYDLTAYSTLIQTRNTMSTDLAFRFDKYSNKLYINTSSNVPSFVTVEYVPRFDNVEEIVSDYWIDALSRMCVANAKIAVGRIRSRFTQSNALWAQDGEQLLSEGTEELNTLREYLQTNSQLVYAID